MLAGMSEEITNRNFSREIIIMSDFFAQVIVDQFKQYINIFTLQHDLVCRVQVDELLALKSATSQRYEQACTALEELLKERNQLRDSLFNTYR